MALVMIELRISQGLVSKLQRISKGSGDYRSQDDQGSAE